MIAPLPPNETARLANLESYGILDTLPEQAYDDIVRLATSICGTSMGLISLVDRDRQWFKATLGLDVAETPREIAFCAHALSSPDRMLTVPDTRADSRFADNPLVTGEPHVRFYAGAPLVTPQNHVLGTLCVIDLVPRELSEAQRQALMALSRQVVAQLELRRQLQELQNSERRFKAFMEMTPAAAFVKDAEGRMLHANPAYLARIGKALPEVLGKTGLELGPAASAAESHDHAMQALKQGQAVNLTEKIETSDGATSYWQTCLFPINTLPETLGGLAIDVTAGKHHEQRLEETQKRLQAALSRLEVLSITDSLTGLHNRRALDERLREEFKRARRYGQPLSFLMIDVDRFKQFNDRYGHPAGDDMLRQVAGALQDNARAQDVVARYGGEEFSIILPSTGPDAALVIADRIRQLVSGLPAPTPVTVSIGISSLPTAAPGAMRMDDPQALVAAADAALYQAKKDGRNCSRQATG